MAATPELPGGLRLYAGEEGEPLARHLHDLTEALRVCERVVLVDGGRIASDTPSKEFLAQTLPIAQQFVAAAGL